MKKMYILAALALLPVFSCDKDNGNKIKNNEKINIVLTKSQQEIVKGNNDFAFELFEEILEAKPDVNATFSPLGVTLAMGMVNNGACGETGREISSVMGFGSDRAAVNDFCKLISEKVVSADKTSTVGIANAVISNSKYPELKRDFRKAVEEVYEANVSRMDFSKDDVLGIINGWCSDKTHKMIPSILDKISADDIFYAMNALYFKGQWKEKFDPAKTIKSEFTLLDSSTKMVDMMSQENEFPAIETDKFKALCLPFGNGAFEMHFILPVGDEDIEDIVDALSQEKWQTIKSSLQSKTVDIRLPKFDISSSLDLIPQLRDLGIRRAFDVGADLTDMSDVSDLYISIVRQNARIMVDEQGAKAAAVTIVGGEMMAPAPPEKMTFHADHPFFFTISESSTGCILFMGQYTGR